jgi:hypothetical protein
LVAKVLCQARIHRRAPEAAMIGIAITAAARPIVLRWASRSSPNPLDINHVCGLGLAKY